MRLKNTNKVLFLVLLLLQFKDVQNSYGKTDTPITTNMLELGLTPNSSKEDVKKAFRKQALIYHPDRDPSPRAKAKFQNLKEAMEECVRRLEGKEGEGFYNAAGYGSPAYGGSGGYEAGSNRWQQEAYQRKRKQESQSMKDNIGMNKARHRQQGINSIGGLLVIGVLFYLATISTATTRRREFILQLRDAERRHRNQFEKLEKAKPEEDLERAPTEDQEIQKTLQELDLLHEGQHRIR
eukprot:TRINITY_DN29224_c0_g1_i2.p1 TRINITY_DN29224_c0_g1~~TRINITY_DN29224_c0_g1_i2.p1  ORF type:complete len:238 (-),score=40.75 TRINITY_DN29224_c0_g1_i2:236-949(-)